MTARLHVAGLVLVLLGGAACTDGGPRYTSMLPLDYRTTYTQVRPCRPSSDHNLNHVQVFADALAAAPYTGRMDPFPVGATILKEEHGLDDTTCSGPVVEWTLMQKLADGTSKATLDFRWQEIAADGDHTVLDQDAKRCISCHADCGSTDSPYGYRWTCSAP